MYFPFLAPFSTDPKQKGSTTTRTTKPRVSPLRSNQVLHEQEVLPSNPFAEFMSPISTISEWEEPAKVLRARGVSVLQKNLLKNAMYGSTVLQKRQHGSCYLITMYQQSMKVKAVVKIFNEEINTQSIAEEALHYLNTTAGVENLPQLLAVSLEPPALITSYHGPNTFLDCLHFSCTSHTLLLQAIKQVLDSNIKLTNDKEILLTVIDFGKDNEREMGGSISKNKVITNVADIGRHLKRLVDVFPSSDYVNELIYIVNLCLNTDSEPPKVSEILDKLKRLKQRLEDEDMKK